jgi:hypothetical protein
MVQQGIQSLMTGGQQGPMPGQAPQMPMQGMMPKPSAATPASVVAQLNAQLSSNPEQRLQQLLQMYAQKPTLALLSQVSEATNAVELEKKKQQQDYMAAFAQQGPQTVADMVKQRAQQVAQTPVMAASGGIMQGYAGGGAVAFKDAGYVPPQEPGETFEEYRQRVIRYQDEKRAAEVARKRARAEEERVAELARRGGPSPASPFFAPAQSTTDTGDEVTRMLGRAPAPVPMAMQDTRGATPDTVAAARKLGTGQSRPAAAPAAQTDTGLAGLMGPTIDPGMLEMRGAVADRQAAIRNAAKTPEDVLKARSGIDALMKEIVDARRAEEQRLMTHSDKRLEEARARAARSPFSDVAYLGQMLEGMRGSKRFGEALAGAASGAGRAQTARSQALQAAEEKYDLSRRDIFNLANLRQQVQLDQAKLIEARATGDADRANKAAFDLAQSREALAKFEIEVQNKSREMGLEERKLAQQGQIAREQMANALKVAGMQADRTPAEVRLMEWLRNPENKKLYESIQASKRAEDRNLKLYEIYMKNKPLLGDMSFEDFAAGLKEGAGASGAGAGEFKVLSSRPKQ